MVSTLEKSQKSKSRKRLLKYNNDIQLSSSNRKNIRVNDNSGSRSKSAGSHSRSRMLAKKHPDSSVNCSNYYIKSDYNSQLKMQVPRELPKLTLTEMLSKMKQLNQDTQKRKKELLSQRVEGMTNPITTDNTPRIQSPEHIRKASMYEDTIGPSQVKAEYSHDKQSPLYTSTVASPVQVFSQNPLSKDIQPAQTTSGRQIEIFSAYQTADDPQDSN